MPSVIDRFQCFEEYSYIAIHDYVFNNYALVNFMPHIPGGDLKLLLVPTPGAIDSCPIH